MLYAIYGLRCGGRADDKARGKAEYFIMQRTPHTECHKSHKALLAHFKWYRVTCAGRRLTILVFHFSDFVICSLVPLHLPANLVPLCHLQADWLTPFDFATHSYSGKEMKRTAAAVTHDEKAPPSDPLAKKGCNWSWRSPIALAHVSLKNSSPLLPRV